MPAQHKPAHQARARAPSHHHQHQHHPSDLDLDSDVTGAHIQRSLAATLDAPPAQRSTNDLNLAVLQKHYPTVTSILSIAPYAVIYTFAAQSQNWEKTGVEGTLFVVNLYSALGLERYALVVLNRRGLENWFIEVKSGDEVEVTAEYIILQGRTGTGAGLDEYADAGQGGGEGAEIYGLWIFCEEKGSTREMRSVNAQLIQDCAARAQESRRVMEVMKQEQQGRQFEERQGGDIEADRQWDAFGGRYPQEQSVGPTYGMASVPTHYQPHNMASPPPSYQEQQQQHHLMHQPSLTEMLNRSAYGQQAHAFQQHEQQPHAYGQHSQPFAQQGQSFNHPQRSPIPSNGHHAENPNVLGDLFHRAASNYRRP